MKKYIYLFLASVAIISFSSCEEDSVTALDTSFVSFESKTLDIGALAGSETSQEVKIYTTNITGADRIISVVVEATGTNANAGAYTVPSTVTIPAGTNVGTLMIGVKDVGLELSKDKSVTIRLQSTEDLTSGSALKINLGILCPNNGIKIKVNLTFDGWPEEGAWRIKDAAGVTVMQSATPFGYGAYAGATAPITVAECLPSGTYTITVYDQYGDGGTAYQVTANGVLVFSATKTNYTASKTATFTI